MTVNIVMLVEGATELAFNRYLKEFLNTRVSANNRPKIRPIKYDGRIPTGDKLKRLVGYLLRGRDAVDAVVALTDVYTGNADFINAEDAKRKMRTWVGPEPRFHPHVAQHDFEAWLLPFWEDIKRLAGSNRASPGPNPESVNHLHPPAHLLNEVFRAGSSGKAYVKPRDAGNILRGKDLAISAQACPELKLLLNTLISISGGTLL
jgi:hypothetical protein